MGMAIGRGRGGAASRVACEALSDVFSSRHHSWIHIRGERHERDSYGYGAMGRAETYTSSEQSRLLELACAKVSEGQVRLEVGVALCRRTRVGSLLGVGFRMRASSQHTPRAHPVLWG